ncbi:regulator of G-protein signaling 21-like isoform X2 [Hoplias malabaricus]|uniref:regulator of G-protein signaling 21-like isoform X2 n=1 Tax=Hoplias malabaricus TaxID=27720 RepID=UPI003462A0FF
MKRWIQHVLMFKISKIFFTHMGFCGFERFYFFSYRHKQFKPRLIILLQKYSASRKKPIRPTQHELDQWAQSLEKLLHHQSGVIAFQMFSKSEFCEENIEFWLACENFRKTRRSKKLAIKARDIYDEFIRKDSPKEINLDFHTRERIGQRLQHPTKTCFDEAQKRIYYLMENNSYPRFLQSGYYNALRASQDS